MLKETLEIKLRAFFSQMQKPMFREVRWLVQGHTDADAIEQPELEIRFCFLIKNSSQCSKKQNHKEKESCSKCSEFKYPVTFFPQCYPFLKPNLLQCSTHSLVSSSRWKKHSFTEQSLYNHHGFSTCELNSIPAKGNIHLESKWL